MKKNILNTLNLIPFIIVVGCGLAYNMIGSEIAADGTLVEPFFLIPIGYLALFVGIIGLIVRLILNNKRKKQA